MLQFAGEFQGELHAGQIQPALLDEVFHLTQLLDIMIGIQAKIARCARGCYQTFAFVLAQRLGMHFHQSRSNADDKEWF
jgi:hypothetical protein